MMLHMKKSLSKSGLQALSVSIFYHTAVLIFLSHCCGAQFQVVGPLQPVTVMIGEDIILPCHLNPSGDAVGMTVEWARPDLNPRFVHVWHEGQNLHVNQHPSYKGRTSVSIDKLKHGDVSLTLSKVKHSDNGIYRCYFPDLDKVSTVELVVGSASSPIISLAGIDKANSGVVLQCESAGWYPEPEVFWLDGEGNLLSDGPTETVRGPDDLYTVSNRVTVEKRHSNSFTCRVQQKNINQTRETRIYISDDFFMAPPSSAACITISLVACFICVLAVVFAVWRWRRSKIKTKATLQREKEQLMAESDRIKDIERKTAEELQKNKEEQKKNHEEMLDTLRKQRNQLNEQKKKVEQQVEDVEKKLLVEKDIKLKEIMCKHKDDLNDTLKALDQMVLNTEKLMYGEKEGNKEPHVDPQPVSSVLSKTVM